MVWWREHCFCCYSCHCCYRYWIEYLIKSNATYYSPIPLPYNLVDMVVSIKLLRQAELPLLWRDSIKTSIYDGLSMTIVCSCVTRAEGCSAELDAPIPYNTTFDHCFLWPPSWGNWKASRNLCTTWEWSPTSHFLLYLPRWSQSLSYHHPRIPLLPRNDQNDSNYVGQWRL